MARQAAAQPNGILSFHNSTDLHSDVLRNLCLEAVSGWYLGGVTVRVRYSRGADYSGRCIYDTRRIYVNLGRHLSYPYRIGTHLARAQSHDQCWWKPVYTIELADAYRVVLFIFLHECFHLLVKLAGRNTRQKEAMCDRFAARHLVDKHGAVVCDPSGRRMDRQEWDFQDLDQFVARCRID